MCPISRLGYVWHSLLDLTFNESCPIWSLVPIMHIGSSYRVGCIGIAIKAIKSHCYTAITLPKKLPAISQKSVCWSRYVSVGSIQSNKATVKALTTLGMSPGHFCLAVVRQADQLRSILIGTRQQLCKLQPTNISVGNSEINPGSNVKNLVTLDARSFQATAPQLWNSLPVSIRMIRSIEMFKKSVKTHLFGQAF